jgi:site-specific recombinase XerD
LQHRRFVGIIERNMSTISLYLERFFSYLGAQSVTCVNQITPAHICGFLRFLAGYSNQTKDHTMRTIRQFMEFCHKNSHHPENLSPYAPFIHYEKRARIPSAYSYDDVMRLLNHVDRVNPIGKRDYAILLLIARLGLRSGDVCNLKYENIDWEQNKISFTQHKTGRPLTLPLLEDVGLAIIDYLKFGRPNCDSDVIFIRHRAPMGPFVSRSVYALVARYIGKAGLLTPNKKHGPHALRHSLASRLLEENVPLPVISEILGHANTETTAVYLSISVEQLRRCALEV